MLQFKGRFNPTIHNKKQTKTEKINTEKEKSEKAHNINLKFKSRFNP